MTPLKITSDEDIKAELKSTFKHEETENLVFALIKKYQNETAVKIYESINLNNNK